MKYKIISRSANSDNYTELMHIFETLINDIMEHGWQPLGGIGLCFIEGKVVVYQAMTNITQFDLSFAIKNDDIVD